MARSRLPWPKCANRVDPVNAVPPADCVPPHLDAANDLAIGENGEGLLKALEILRADQHRRGSAITRDQDPFVLSLDPVDIFGATVLDCAKRFGRHGQNCAAMVGWAQSAPKCVLARRGGPG